MVRRELKALRVRRRAIPDVDAVLARVRAGLHDVRASRIQPVINGTGILVHTNFGRAPLGADVDQPRCRRSARTTATSNTASTGGARGGRAAYLEHGLAVLCGAEAATVVNNNAAALVLILRALLSPEASNEVVISRGELVQIGGGFRIPDVLESSGARLREVGTTNQTSLNDYARAITRQTALILKVHRSNFFMDGFVESPPTEDIAALARKKRVPFVEDLGSGAMIDTADGRRASSTSRRPPKCIRSRRRSGLLQRRQAVRRSAGRHHRRPPEAGRRAQARAAVPRAALRQADSRRRSKRRWTRYLRGDAGACRCSRCCTLTNDDCAPAPSGSSRRSTGCRWSPRVGAGRAQIGGGTLPRSAMPSVTLDLTHRTLKPQELARRLREQPMPVIGYVAPRHAQARSADDLSAAGRRRGRAPSAPRRG